MSSPQLHPSQAAVTRSPFQAPPELAARISAAAATLLVEAGESVFTAGSPANGVYLLTSGTVRAYLPAEDGRELICRTLSAGSLLGLPAAMCAKVYQFTVEAVDNVMLTFVETAVFNELLRENTDLCMLVLGMMSDELTEIRQTHEHMRNCTNTSCSLHGACSQHLS
ncbi:MAG TPA: Crp/Fnr family transcriptional regulator [Candidatus Acidoferrales bacterium]|nr:Crp/Fnr family transcriptional regulator [Candidatus Acidoferrales bacterium]